MTDLPSSCDVGIVGGGPAGLAAAIAFRRKGLSVAVFDCAEPAIDKACGEGLLPGALLALSELGISLPLGFGYPLLGIGFTNNEGQRATAQFRSGSGVGLRRTVLHSTLVHHATAAGASLHWGAKQIDLLPDGILVGEHPVFARWIIGADGQNSFVRRRAVLDKGTSRSARFGFRQHFRIEPWSQLIEIYWGPGFQIYITPIASDEVGVAVLTRDQQFRVDSALEWFPELAARFEGAEPTSDERGSVTGSRKYLDVSRGRLALLGDASGSVDAITGEGLCGSFRQAAVLAEAIVSGDLDGYKAQHRSLSRRPQVMSRLLLTLGDHPALRGLVMGTFARFPACFDTMLAVHTGEPWRSVFRANQQPHHEGEESPSERVLLPRP